jgi:anti-sigma B factor antagonist
MTAPHVGRDGLFSVRVAEAGDELAVHAAGELDIASAPALEHSMLHALESGATSIVLDLTGVTFIDRMGLGVVLWAARSDENGDSLRIRVGSAVRRMIEMTGVERLLPLIA